jgi:STE24 endopeptidase
LFLAFGYDSGQLGQEPPMGMPDACLRAGEAAAGVLLVAVCAFGLGRLVAFRVQRIGRASSLVRRVHRIGTHAIDVLSLLVYGWIIHGLDWPRVIRSGFRLGDPILLDDALVLLPFLLAQLAGWWGLHAAEQAVRPLSSAAGARRYLWLKARQSLGMVLPVAAIYALGADVVHRLWPATATSPWDQTVSLALMGVLVLVLAPLFVRIAWPTRPLPPGPLRDRLEHLAHRFGFHCTDILVWDTNQVIVNAGVTGSLPWFRYVLLTDALVENLSTHEIAAVFGHEVGHIAHRHLLYFGFFLVSSLTAIAMAGEAFAMPDLLPYLPAAISVPGWLTSGTVVSILTQGAVILAAVGYFLGVFGFVSRRFERQADIHGCRVVSCGRTDCPPHADFDALPASVKGPAQVALCPVGIRIFINSLANVAILNGMRPAAWSWRHGSIARRIEFLESLIERPENELRFQDRVRRMRRGLAVVLTVAVAVLAAVTWNVAVK